MNVITSHLHNIFTEEVNNVALSADDDKKIFLKDGIHTLGYGHGKKLNSLKRCIRTTVINSQN